MILEAGTSIYVDAEGQEYRTLTKDIEVTYINSSSAWPGHIWVRYKKFKILVYGSKDDSVIYSSLIAHNITRVPGRVSL